MSLRLRTILVLACLCLATTAAWSGLTPYDQDYEALDQADPNALRDVGWLVFGNVFWPNGAYHYGYGPFPAPNGGAGFSAVAAGEGGPDQGARQMVVYSDYNNSDHALGKRIEANVFQEQRIDAGDVGQVWQFRFDAKLGDIAGESTAFAFIKTLDPAAGYALTNFISIEMTTTPVTWTGYTIEIAIDPSLPGQILQFGYLNNATYYQPSGVLYDNVVFRRKPIEVAFDVRPAGCPNPLNTRSEGVLPTAILGTDTFDVGEIDLDSLKLEGAAPVKVGYDDVAAPFTGELGDNACGCTDAGPDGYLDLELKFDTQDLELAAEDGRLMLTGRLLDGTPIEGVDCIVRVGRMPTPDPTGLQGGWGSVGATGFRNDISSTGPSDTTKPLAEPDRERVLRDRAGSIRRVRSEDR